MCAAVTPGSRPVRVRRLAGGLDAGMHTVDLLEPSGARRRVVLRRYSDRSVARDPALPQRAWRTLGALEPLGVPAPRPVWPDLDGAVFGTPSFVMSHVPGRGILRPRDPADWARQLAEALAALHRAPLERVDLGFLEDAERHLDRQLSWAMHHTRDPEQNRDNAAVRSALQRWRPCLPEMSPVLNHGDYWAGNVLWRRGRLAAIVDWDSAAIGYAGMDVGYTHMDLAMMGRPDVAETFLRSYEEASGSRIPYLFFWDLLGASRALPDPERWLPGYQDFGRTDVTPELMRDRLHAFIANALARAGTQPRRHRGTEGT